jgi:hypothetical protein
MRECRLADEDFLNYEKPINFSLSSNSLSGGDGMSDKKDNEIVMNLSSIKFPKIGFPQLSIPPLELRDFAAETRAMLEGSLFNEEELEEMHKERERKEAAEIEFRNNVIKQLNTIATNTANLSTIAELIHKNNKNQDEIIQLLTECLSLSKAETREEADSKYRQLMNRITQTVQDIETIQTITGFLNTVYSGVINLL